MTWATKCLTVSTIDLNQLAVVRDYYCHLSVHREWVRDVVSALLAISRVV